MQGALEIRLGAATGGITPRAYSTALQEITYSLEELDRLVEPEPSSRVSWYVSDTAWMPYGPTIRLRPDARGAARSSEQLLRPSLALVRGVQSLQVSPQIPPDFTERVVNRIAKVGSLAEHSTSTGLTSVTVAPADSSDVAASAEIDRAVDENAKRAVAPVSLAYGSVIGRLDVISARTKRTQIGLVTDFGPPINCVVDNLESQDYLAAFNSRVLVAGLVKRNASGQIIRIDADSLDVLPEPQTISVDMFRGALSNPGNITVEQFIREQRGE